MESVRFLISVDIFSDFCLRIFLYHSLGKNVESRRYSVVNCPIIPTKGFQYVSLLRSTFLIYEPFTFNYTALFRGNQVKTHPNIGIL